MVRTAPPGYPQQPSAPGRPPQRNALVRNVAIGMGLVLVLILAIYLVQSPSGSAPQVARPTEDAAALYVAPQGNDNNDGASADAPLQTIQAALDVAEPGTTINLAPGEYREKITTQRDGEPDAPITIRGPETGQDPAGRHQATLYGTNRIVNIDHSYIRLEGFTVDGQEKLKGRELPTDLAEITAFKDSVAKDVADGRLVYIGSSETSRDITGVTIENMFLTGAGGECVRLRNNAHDNVINNSVIQYCGMFGKQKDDDEDRFAYHNGEGVYIGTSPKSDDQPMHENDASSANRITGNIIRTFGSECFNVKENAAGNLFENNTCDANAEPGEFDGSNIELRGHDNIVRGNTISGSAGFGVKIRSDSEEYDKGGNTVENNKISDIAVATFQVESKADQGPICGNTLTSAGALFDPNADDEDAGVVANASRPC